MRSKGKSQNINSKKDPILTIISSNQIVNHNGVFILLISQCKGG